MSRTNLASAIDTDHGVDTTVVEEVFNGSSGYVTGPVRALMSALLFDGVQSYLNYMSSESHKHRMEYREAFYWINSTDKKYIFSFENVCEGLGIDPNYLRCGLINAGNSQFFEWKRSRRSM